MKERLDKQIEELFDQKIIGYLGSILTAFDLPHFEECFLNANPIYNSNQVRQSFKRLQKKGILEYDPKGKNYCLVALTEEQANDNKKYRENLRKPLTQDDIQWLAGTGRFSQA